ncbi:MAG: hypothetical protein KDJ35_00865 [Alphaproteobacteria bacterium]|nr:hypothetical protein [Alphaproteobacteria bacterium]
MENFSLESLHLVGLVNTDPFLLFFGGFFMVLGFSAFLAKEGWLESIKLFQDSSALSLMMGVLMLPVSLWIVVFYDDWSSISSTVLMVIGYFGLVKSVVFLVFPKVVQRFFKVEFVQKWLWLDGVSGIVLGAALLFL